LKIVLVLAATLMLVGCRSTDWGDKSEKLGRKAALFKVSPAPTAVAVCENGSTKDEQTIDPTNSTLDIEVVVAVRTLAKSIDEEFGTCTNLNDHLDISRLEKGWQGIRDLMSSASDSSVVTEPTTIPKSEYISEEERQNVVTPREGDNCKVNAAGEIVWLINVFNPTIYSAVIDVTFSVDRGQGTDSVILTDRVGFAAGGNARRTLEEVNTSFPKTKDPGYVVGDRYPVGGTPLRCQLVDFTYTREVDLPK
jgi:hypothetical protein